MSDDLKVIIPGMTRLEQLDLEEALPGEVDFRAEELAPDQHGEFLTAAAVVTLTTLAMRTLAIWLAKNRSRDNVIEEEVTLELKDGTRVTRKLRVEARSSSQLPDAAVGALQGLVNSPD